MERTRTSHILRAACLVLIYLGISGLLFAGTVYVMPTASGDESGSSWANATDDIQAAIDALGTTEVWVAAGTYYAPDSSGFTPKDGVNVYGGFEGTESTLSERERSDLDSDGVISTWEYTNQTILSGDIDHATNTDNYSSWPDNVGTSMDNNANHVIYQLANFGSETTWGGLVIQGGAANEGSAPDNQGGGVYGRQNFNLVNSYVRYSTAADLGGGFYGYRTLIAYSRTAYNRSLNKGGGIYNNSATVNECLADNNYATNSGAGIYNYGATSIVTNSSVMNNGSDDSGGGLYIYLATISNVDVYSNDAAGHGGGIYNNDGNIENCRIYDNTQSAYGQGGGIYSYKGSISGSDIYGNTSTAEGGGAFIRVDASISSCKIYNNKNTYSYADGGGLNIQSSSTAENCLIYNNTSADLGGGVYNSDCAITNLTVVNNHAVDNGGGIYNTASATVHNTAIWGNSTDATDAQMNSLGSITYTAMQGSTPSGTGNMTLNSANAADATSPYFTSPTSFTGVTGGDSGKESSLASAVWDMESSSALIDNGNATNAPADDIDGYTRSTIDIGAYEYHTVSEPTSGTTNITAEQVYSGQINLSWTNGNGSNRAVFALAGSSGTASPADNSSYTASSTFGSGDQIGTSGWYCIYNGSDSSVTVTGLSANTVYRFMSCEYNGNGSTEDYKTDSETNNPVNVQTDESDIPLPISLQSFTAEFIKGNVNLQWASASETENDHFNIYRNDELLATILGHGTTSEPHDYVFVDRSVGTGSYTYMLADVDYSGHETQHANMKRTVEISEANLMPMEFSLADAFPNPFNPLTTLSYSLKEESDVLLTIYDMTGKAVMQWSNQQQAAGWYILTWNARNESGQALSSGIYFYRLTAGNFTNTKKMLLLK